MSSSEESSDEESHVLYKNREEWRDLTPIDPEKDFQHKVVKIAYSDEFKDCFDYFRAVCEKEEYSERALELTAECIKRNHANYSVWEYRRRILQHLDKNLDSEFDFTQKMLRRHIKNFQIWHHRQILCEWAGDGSREKKMTDIIFSLDQKNYHAWQHRQWVIKRFELYDGEMEFAANLLDKDVYNNSAWNHRHFCIQNTTTGNIDVRERELDFVKSKLEMAINNESGWNYLRAILNHKLADFPDISSRYEDKYDLIQDKGNKHSQLAAYVADYLCERAENGETLAAVKATEIFSLLSSELDPVRKNYWNYLSSCVSEMK